MFDHTLRYPALLFAVGPRGSLICARSLAKQHNHLDKLKVAFKLARAIGLIQNKYFSIDRHIISPQVSLNLSKTQAVFEALERLEKDNNNPITRIKNGKIYFRDDSTRTAVIDSILTSLSAIKGYGDIDKEAASKKLKTKSIRSMLIPESKYGLLQKAEDIVRIGGTYNFLFLRPMALNIAAKKILGANKIIEAKKATGEIPIPSMLDDIYDLAKREAHELNIETIKKALQADNLAPITKFEGLDDLDAKFTFVLSDLHLKNYPHENRNDFLRFIWMAKRLGAEIILNGDTYDVWRSGGLEKIDRHNLRITNGLGKLKSITLVVGNHDEFLKTYVSRGGILYNPTFLVREEVRMDQNRIRICHGHQFDRFNRPGARLGRIATKATAKIELPFITKVFQLIDKMTLGVLHLPLIALNHLFGSRFSERLLFILKFFRSTKSIWEKQSKQIINWLDDEIKIAEIEGTPYSEIHPLFFIIGHLHYEGISFYASQLKEEIAKKYGNKVKLIITDSWSYSGDYAGDYVCITEQKDKDVEIKKEVWQKTA